MDFASPAWPAVIAVVLLATVLMERVPLPVRSLGLFKALFPSWRFFEDVGPSPRLFHRTIGRDVLDVDTCEVPWTDTLPPQPRGPGALFLNARGNLRFTGGSVLDQLVAEIGDLPDAALGTFEAVEGLVAYRLVQRMVVERLGPDVGAYQIRVVLDETGEEILRSPVHVARIDDPEGQGT